MSRTQRWKSSETSRVRPQTISQTRTERGWPEAKTAWTALNETFSNCPRHDGPLSNIVFLGSRRPTAEHREPTKRAFAAWSLSSGGMAWPGVARGSPGPPPVGVLDVSRRVLPSGSRNNSACGPL